MKGSGDRILRTGGADRRPVPALLPDHGREVHRRLTFDGADNFRDIGGYHTDDGRRLKWGIIYRSGHLGSLSRTDLAFVRRLGIRRVVDLRGDSEIASRPDRLPRGVEYSRLPVDIAGADLRSEVYKVIRGTSAMDLRAFMRDVNRRFVTEYAPSFGAWLKIIGREPGPHVIHCTAGKDRAGFAAALLLRILGVPDSTVMEDYLKSNICTRDAVERTIRKVSRRGLRRRGGEVIRPLLTSDPDYLGEAFHAIRSGWGGFDAFVETGLGLDADDRSRLRELLLE